MPIQNIREIPTKNEMAEVINSPVKEYFTDHDNLPIACEPGRSMAGDEGIDVYLPEDVNKGDHVYVINAGAYTTGYVSHFNGIEPPKICFLQDL